MSFLINPFGTFGAPPAGWQPDDEASLTAWYKASTTYGGLTDGDTLSADWTDLSGNSKDMTPGYGPLSLTAPEYDDGVFASGAARQTGSNSGFGAATGPTWAANDDVMFAVAFRPESWVGSNPGLWRPSSGQFLIFQGSTGRPWIRWGGADILKPGSGTALSTGTSYSMVVRIRDQTDYDVWLNGVNEWSGTHTRATAADTITYMFSQATGTQLPTGPFAEAMWFAGSGTTPDPADVNGYMNDVYGL